MQIERDAFIVWLHSHEEEACVGTSSNPNTCPIGQFFLSLGADYVFIGRAAWLIAHGDRIEDVNPPKWASMFDLWCEDKGYDVEITAAQALSFFLPPAPLDRPLDEVEPAAVSTNGPGAGRMPAP